VKSKTRESLMIGLCSLHTRYSWETGAALGLLKTGRENLLNRQ